MRHETISAPEVDRGRLPASPISSRRSRFLIIAAAVSVGVHVLAALTILILPRLVPQEARPQEQGTVELLMVEQKGDQPSQAGNPDETKPVPPRPPEARKTEPKKEEKAPPARKPPPVQTATQGDEPAPPEETPPKPDEADAKPEPKQAAAPPSPPPQPQQAPVFDLEGTESESNATAMGTGIIPASRDDRYRNKPPPYPLEAQMNNQHGNVVVVIHVGANGLPTGVDVLQSSGYRLLDQAAIDAVRKWHFRPAIEHGQPVAFDMPFRFLFEP